eukprot:g4292.t1
MQGSKASKLPQSLKEAREKQEEKDAKKREKAEKKAKAKPKAKGKASASAKRGPNALDEIEEFTPDMIDINGQQRQTLFGDDVLNAINYTLERVPGRDRRKDFVSQALDLSVHFALEGNLESAGIAKITAWTRARQHIKGLLNRAHALKARMSDPDKPADEHGTHGGDHRNAVALGDDEADEGSDCQRHLVCVLKAFNEKAVLSFVDANFNFSECDGDLSDEESVQVPTLATAMDTHPGIMLVANKVKKQVRSKVLDITANDVEKGNLLMEFILEILKAVNATFEPAFLDVAISLCAVSQAVDTASDPSRQRRCGARCTNVSIGDH